MAEPGTNRLRKRRDTVTLTFAVYDLELDDQSRREMAADPEQFLRTAIEAEGQAVNGIIMDSAVKLSADGTMPEPQVYHCEAPPRFVSKWITIVL